MKKVLGALTVGLGLVFAANATPVTVDTIIANPVTGTLAGSVDMSVSGSTLTIRLVNLSTSGVGDAGANILLTGIGFSLPGSLSIVGGSVSVGNGSFIEGGSKNGLGFGTDLLGEWGYANEAQGHFNGLTVDSLVSTMDADTDVAFGGGPIDPPPGLNGPEYGLVATGGDRGGLTAVRNSVEINLLLSGTFSGNLINAIDGGTVALTFGSPTGQGVPDGGATVMLLGAALVGVNLLRRKLS